MSNNATLDSIRTYNQRHADPLCSDLAPVTPVPTTRSAPARRQIEGTAFAPRLTMSRPSEAQTSYIKSLLADIVELDAEQGTKLRKLANECWAEGKMTPGRGGGASSWIENLKDLRTALRDRAAKAAPKPKREIPAVPAGRYAIDTLDGAINETAFYVVRVSDTGFVTVLHQVSSTLTKLDWAHTLSVLKRILEAGLKEAALRYGRELHHCSECGRELTNDTSRAIGIGPECAKKRGW